jgi:hypothetical protein
MARGMKCPSCGAPMYAQEEKYYPAGTEVVYECVDKSCRNRVKVFEDSR